MTWKPTEAELPAIAKVDSLDGDCFDILLSNGHSIFLELGDRTGEPAFQRLIEQRLFDRPQTDGKRIYWVDGPSFTVAEILTMLAKGKENEEIQNLKGDETK